MADPLQQLQRLHEEIDRLAEEIASRHPGRLQCRLGCASCCVDELTVFEIEAAAIRQRYGDELAKLTPRAPGSCALLAPDDSCLIYEVRPYVCRTQGLPLRWVDAGAEGAIEYRDICPLNLPGPALEDLPAEACWTIGPFETRLRNLQITFGGPGCERIALRDLFSRGK